MSAELAPVAVTSKSGDADDKSILAEARERWKIADDAESDQRAEATDDIRFVAGEQWPDEVKKKRAGRPCPVNNRLPTYIKQVVNEQKRSRPAICVSPVGGGANVQTATVLQGMVRHIERISRAEVAYDTAFEYAVTSGKGHFRVKTGYTSESSFDQELMIERIENPFTVYTDPMHIEPDAIDAKWRFVTEWVDCDDFDAKYGFKPTTLKEAGKGDDAPDWFDDDKIRVAEYWRVVDTEVTMQMLSDGTTIEGPITKAQIAQMQFGGVQIVKARTGMRRTVEQYLLTGDRIIQKSEWLGKYIPIITVTGNTLIVDGKRRVFSLIRFAKDAQRMDNFWAGTEAELLAMQPKVPWIATPEQLEGHEAEWIKANTENMAYLLYNAVPGVPPPMRQQFSGTPSGVREARMAAQEDIKAILGMYDASLGARSNEVSGVAIRARQSEGDTATYHFIDAQAKAVESCGRVLIDLIPKIYDNARTVRIIKPDDQAQMVAINSIFTDPQTGQPTKHDLALGQYDVTVKVGPSFESQREEARAAMLELIGQFPQSAPVISDLVVKNMDWPGADEISQRLKTMVPPQALGKPAPPDPMQQVEQAKSQQIMEKGQLDLELKKIDAQIQQGILQDKARDQQMQGQLKGMELEMKHMELQQQQVLHQQTMELAAMKLQQPQGQPPDQTSIIVAHIKAAADQMKTELQEETKRMIAAGRVYLELNTNVPQPLDQAIPSGPVAQSVAPVAQSPMP